MTGVDVDNLGGGVGGTGGWWWKLLVSFAGK